MSQVILLEDEPEKDLVDRFEVEFFESGDQLQNLLELEDPEEIEDAGVSSARDFELRLKYLVEVDQVDGDEVPHERHIQEVDLLIRIRQEELYIRNYFESVCLKSLKILLPIFIDFI